MYYITKMAMAELIVWCSLFFYSAGVLRSAKDFFLSSRFPSGDPFMNYFPWPPNGEELVDSGESEIFKWIDYLRGFPERSARSHNEGFRFRCGSPEINWRKVGNNYVGGWVFRFDCWNFLFQLTLKTYFFNFIDFQK